MNEVKTAREMAVEAHEGQLYGSRPYVAHLDAVFALVGHMGVEEGVWSYIHDLLEDVPKTDEERQHWIQRIKDTFGARIAIGSQLLCDEAGRNRKERKQRTNSKLSRVTEEYHGVLAVKLADRLTNVRKCFTEGNSMLAMYRREHSAFREAVYRDGLCQAIQDELDSLLLTTSSNR